eukprot:12423653-Karenia_brevis.AAC.1
MIATLSRIQWHVKSAYDLVTDDGMKIDLRIDSPEFIKGLLTQSVERWRWRRVERQFPVLCSDGHGRGAWWKPVAHVLRQPDREGWGPAEKGALKSAIMGRQWPQQRLFKAGLATDSSCQLCYGMSEGSCCGTLCHRVECPALRDFVSKTIPEWVRPCLAVPNAGMSDLMHFGLTRGLCPAPE